MAGELMDGAAVIERHMLRPFRWGESDCCLAVCAVLADLGLADPASAYRGLYRDEAGARALTGGDVPGLAAAICARLGWRELVPGEQLQDGDVGVLGQTLAIFWGGWWHLKSERGYACRRQVQRAWRPR